MWKLISIFLASLKFYDTAKEVKIRMVLANTMSPLPQHSSLRSQLN